MKKIIFAICTMFALSANAKTELITVQGDHGKLDVKIQTPDASAKCPLLILCHGFCGSKDGKLFDCIVDSVNKKGIAVLRFDFNGHGKSEGRFEDMTVPNEIEDAKSILRYAVLTALGDGNSHVRSFAGRCSGSHDQRTTCSKTGI